MGAHWLDLGGTLKGDFVLIIYITELPFGDVHSGSRNKEDLNVLAPQP